MSQLQRHIPVMLNESIDAMNIVSNGTYIDATFVWWSFRTNSQKFG